MSDFKGFKAYISSNDEFPLLMQKGFSVPYGHHTLVALTPTLYDTDSSLQDIPSESRKCLFPFENDVMTIFEKYSQNNCFLECALQQTYKSIIANDSNLCTMWYLPMYGNSSICGSASRKNFVSYFDNINFAHQCKHCLPDCAATKYSHFITSEKFRAM